MFSTLRLFLITTVLSPGIAAGGYANEGDALGGLRMLPGYEHHPTQGIDSETGKILKKGGLVLHYEIGRITPPGTPRIGGDFENRASLSPQSQTKWSRDHEIAGQPISLALTKEDLLLASFPATGTNFYVRIESDEDLADALLMILTYPMNDKREKPPTAASPKS